MNTQNKATPQLTRHSTGSVAELITLSFPLILTALSGNLKLTLDRIMLSYYSIDSLHALAGINLVFAVFYLPGIAISGMSEVFVGQYNGSQQHTKVGEPVWQMIWFAFFSFALYIPLAFIGDTFFIADAHFNLGQSYFQIVVCFCPFWLIQAAINGFFIGIGKPKIITYITVAGSLLNLAFNYIFIFGKLGLPPMGAVGAGIASVIASLIEISIVLSVFLNKTNALKFHTRKLTFNFKLMLQAVKIGGHNALGHIIEVGGWAFLSNFRSAFGIENIMVNTLTSTAFVLFTFVTDGLGKASTAITANIIGSNQLHLLPKLKQSLLKMLLILCSLLFLPLVVFSSATIQAVLDTSALSETTLWVLKLSLFGTFLFMSLDAFFWTTSGMLTAGGDTQYVMIVNSLSMWLLGVVPAVIWLTYVAPTPYAINVYFLPLYMTVTILFLNKRINSNKWVKLKL